jgi:diguanylate cyclase (GGDEF)-like protein
MSLDEAIGQLEKLVAEIRRVSFTDDKTRLGSALALRQEERLISEGASDFSVVVFGDLNDFKRLNDEHGHEAGDVAIKEVGETIYKIVVDDLQAKAFRQSGDEFVILLKQGSVERFLSNASSFGDILFSYDDKDLRTAMSLGYAISDGKTSFRDLLKRAEDACQNAKALGDGVCVMWSEDIKLNPLIRIPGRCQKCSAKISCNVPAQNAPAKLKLCPCCGELL